MEEKNCDDKEEVDYGKSDNEGKDECDGGGEGEIQEKVTLGKRTGGGERTCRRLRKKRKERFLTGKGEKILTR